MSDMPTHERLARGRLELDVLGRLRQILGGPTVPKRDLDTLERIRGEAMAALRRAEETWLAELWPPLRFDVELHEHPERPGHVSIGAVRVFEDRPGEVRWR